MLNLDYDRLARMRPIAEVGLEGPVGSLVMESLSGRERVLLQKILTHRI